MNIAGTEVGQGFPCRVVAEISNNHNGSLETAKRLIRECAGAGAAFIKFQCYHPDELVELRGDGPAPAPWDDWTMRDLYEKAQTPHEWFPELVAECNRAGVPWFSSVFGWQSFEMLTKLGCPAYKIAALDVNTQFAADVAYLAGRVYRPVIASSRGERIDWADLTLYCPEGYPQDELDLAPHNLILDGLSYHGTDPDIAAFGLRQAMLEVHVQLDDEPSELEAGVSLTVSQLRELCKGPKPGWVLS